ncbi:MAG: hypothetical protein GTN78_04055, partial [Gemmatimonadales bacterium]|nr:hypothetical protein [Gemmatimonadales bacterium]NIN12237.1 hypothetical protein [Gemmatimonadales bacterium]NIQ99360.1 hypothetical protein [Gemmatimonadales bacterium]NIS64041.1 hypothetical protein [Gemmatimonadales bacterium]
MRGAPLLHRFLLVVALVGCTDAGTDPGTPPGTSPPYKCDPWCSTVSLPFDALRLADIPTYDGSGQTVHPDVVYLPDGFGPDGQTHWLGITPYPGGDAHFENPSVYASMNALYMDAPRGLENPLVIPDTMEEDLKSASPPPFPDEAGQRLAQTDRSGYVGHFSDPDIVWNDGLYLYYRYSTDSDFLFRISSRDGVEWSQAELVLRGPYASLLSPAVVVENDWQMWSVDARDGGCRATMTTVSHRRSQDGVRWSDATSVELSLPGHVVWHLDVQWMALRREYWTLVAAWEEGASCGATDVFFGWS